MRWDRKHGDSVVKLCSWQDRTQVVLGQIRGNQGDCGCLLVNIFYDSTHKLPEFNVT